MVMLKRGAQTTMGVIHPRRFSITCDFMDIDFWKIEDANLNDDVEKKLRLRVPC